MTDISSAGFELRGAPVTLISEGVEALLRWYGARLKGLDLILRTAEDVESSGCILQSSAVGDATVWVEKGCAATRAPGKLTNAKC